MTAKRKVVAGVLATVVGLSSVTLVVYSEQLDSEHQMLVADQVEVVKAARGISAGSPLVKERITTEMVPRKFLPANPLTEAELDLYLGVPLTTAVEEGAMLLTSDFEVSSSLGMESPMLIKMAKLTIESGDSRKASERALILVAQRGGYVVKSDLRVRQSKAQSFSMIARIPATEFESTLVAARSLGTTTDEWIRGAGITDEVRELEERLGFKTQRESELNAAAQKKAERVRDVEIISGNGTTILKSEERDSAAPAEAARELAQVREELAQLRSERSALGGQVAMSTIEIHIAPAAPPVVEPSPPGFAERAGAAFAQSADTLAAATFVLVRCVAAVLPFAVFLSPLMIAVMMWRRRRFRI